MKLGFNFSPGSTLYWPCDLVSKYSHLWVILTQPFSNPAKIVMVMVTSKKSYSPDISVELNIGDHPFIRHLSVVSYIDANYFRLDRLEEDINSGIARPKEPFNKSILIKIQNGLLKSKFTPKGIKNFCFNEFKQTTSKEGKLNG